MFLLSDVLDSYRNEGLNASVSILFNKNKFSNKIYLYSNTAQLNQPAFHKIYNSLISRTIEGNTNSFLVKSISSWVTSSLNFLVSMTSKELSIELGNAPSVITDLFEKLPRELFDLTVNHTLIEISCVTLNQHSVVDLLLNDTYISTQKFQLIYETNKSYKVIDVLEPTKNLEAIKKQKSLMDELIHQKLDDSNGSLSGIRHAYAKHNINYFLVCLLHGIKNIDEYEKAIKVDFFSEAKNPTPSKLSVDNQNSKLNDSISKKLTSNTLIDDLLVPNECETIVERIRKFTPTPFNVEKLLKVEEYKFEWLQGITPEMIQSFKIFKAMLRDDISGFSTKTSLLKVTESVKTSLKESDVYLAENILLKSNHPKVYKSSTSNLDKEPLLNVNDLKPNYICIGDWEDILTVASEAVPNDKNGQIVEINSQIQHFSDFRDTYLDGFNQEIIKAKETADWLFPGDFVKQLDHLDEEIKKLRSTVDSVKYVEAGINEIKPEKPSTDQDFNSASNIENVPNDVLAKIKEWAFEGYFDDKEMYNLFVQEQLEAYIELSNTEPQGMPEWVWKSICDYTESKYVGDFSGQLREAKKHIESYFSIGSILRTEDADELREIKQSAREDRPGNYKGQLQFINASLKVLDSEKKEVSNQEIATQEIANLRPKEIMAWDWEETLKIALMACPNDPIRQLKVLKLQVGCFYDIDGMTKQGYENEVDSLKKSAGELFAGDYVKQLSNIISDIGKLAPKSSVFSQEEPWSKPADIVKSVTNKKVKELNNSAVDDKNKSEKSFLSKLSSIFKSNRPRDIVDNANTTVIKSSIKELGTAIETEEALAPNTTIEATSVKELKLIETTEKVVDSKVQSEPSRVEECHFVKFNKKNEIGIEVQALKSFDAFDFESINNKLIVIINSNHPFYNKLYRDSSVESKRVIDMMISSLCHLSHLNISETVKQQDKKLFARWSEYLEEYLLEE